MTPLQKILAAYRATSQTEREKGTYFEELIRTYFRFEASYADLYSDVWLFADWAKAHGFSAKDTGIDLVAKTHGTEEFHAIQCKCYAEDYRVRKADIDSFFTASGQAPFTQRIIVTTTNDWSENAENALIGQTPPVYKIDLQALETSQIDWAKYQPTTAPALKAKKELRKHQTSAKTNVLLGFKSADRGKLIMACGTGKTFTSLKIAEEVAGPGKITLFLVPSLNLLSQTLTEWTQESAVPLHSFAVCSDAEVGKKRAKDEDIVETFAHELRYPATTDAKRLAHELKKRHDAQHMSVIFSTYHSLDVISRAQHLYGLPPIDLVICDEAHRTTGATFESDDESNFVKIHDNEFIKAAKRLYMTATPRIYADSAKATAEKDNVAICSMDDETLYGKQFHVITFSEAVELKLLTDYKVLVLTIDEAHVSSRIQDLLKDDNNQLKVDDAARIIGCWKALAKQGLAEDLSHDPEPMKRAVAFCQVIERQKGGKVHKVSSKQIAAMFSAVVEAYQKQEDSDNHLLCEAAHVDGTMNAAEKEEKLNWLKAEVPENTCRILSNVRCLSEGVDVPALDAVLFLTPRNSQVDVVQSVGRVMRRTPDGKKKLGYVILPVVIPAGMEPHEALNDNKVYKVVWDVLQALRSHDDRFDAMINKLDLIGSDHRKMEVIAITDSIQKKAAKAAKGESTNAKAGKNEFSIGTPESPVVRETQAELQFKVGELERALYAKVVKKCGNRSHWEDWANDIAKIANTHISRITQIVKGSAGVSPASSKGSVGVSPASSSDVENAGGTPALPSKEYLAFQSFAKELRDDLNDSITDAEVIEMLAQHLITKPVFDALFKDYSFASHNPVSVAMQQVLDVLQEHRLEKEADTLEKFYASVAMRAEGIDNAEGKQKIVVELYDKFFRNAFPKMTERLGIVYTPVEVVDFIIHSINDLLQQEFGQTLGSKGVHIIDPFTGTGTFITRLLQSGLIKPSELPHKYKHEIHANEIVLLAYYIAAINIEAVYHSLVSKHAAGAYPSPAPKGRKPSPVAAVYDRRCEGGANALSPDASASSAPTGQPIPAQGNALGPNPPKNPSPVGAPPSYEPFQGICLTDTFQLYEKGDMISNLLTNNSDRRKRQKALDIRVIMGNPPYNAGSTTDGDGTGTINYPELDQRIRETYAAGTTATNKKALYDSYIRAIRWGSDRLGDAGIMAFVSGSAWIERSFAAGMRKCLADEFSDLYVFHLRGDVRKDMLSKGSSKQGGNIFESGSMTGIAISLFVKNKSADHGGKIMFHDIGENLSGAEKRDMIKSFRSINGISGAGGWQSVTPDQHHDWVGQRDSSFGEFIKIGDKKDDGPLLAFETYSNGIKTNSDAWCYNFSLSSLKTTMKRMIGFYNSEAIRYQKSGRPGKIEDFVNRDPTLISWHSSTLPKAAKGIEGSFSESAPHICMYRPFQKEWLYYDSMFIQRVALMPQIFPACGVENQIISLSGVGAQNQFSCFITNCLADLHCVQTGQCFPLYLYDQPEENKSDDLFSKSPSTPTRRDAITDAGLAHFQQAYPASGEGGTITKEDLFYYIYGLLHSPDYRSRYADNLSKELPRIPAVKTFKDFMAFSQAGRELAHWHLNYESVECHPGVTVEEAQSATVTDRRYRVEKMKFAKKKDPDTGKSVNDKTTVIYNDFITIKNIPLDAYDYIVNGKPALEWVMERQAVTTDKDSGITNDANLWATETIGNARYPLELFLRVVTVSLETNRIVAGLPGLEISVESSS
jgi:predicted helicase